MLRRKRAGVLLPFQQVRQVHPISALSELGSGVALTMGGITGSPAQLPTQKQPVPEGMATVRGSHDVTTPHGSAPVVKRVSMYPVSGKATFRDLISGASYKFRDLL